MRIVFEIVYKVIYSFLKGRGFTYAFCYYHNADTINPSER